MRLRQIINALHTAADRNLEVAEDFSHRQYVAEAVLDVVADLDIAVTEGELDNGDDISIYEIVERCIASYEDHKKAMNKMPK